MRSLRNIIGVTITLLLGGIAVVRGASVGWEAEGLLRQEVGRSLGETAKGLAERLDADMRARTARAAILGSLEALQDPRSAQRLVDEILTRDPSTAWVGVTDAQGTVVAASGGILVGQSVAQRPVFQRAQDGMFVGDVHDAVLLAKLLPNPSGEPMKFVDVSVPLKGPAGKTVGVLAFHYSWSWARDVVGALLDMVRNRTGTEVLVMAVNGTALLGPDGTMGKPLVFDGLEAVRARGDGWEVARWPDGREYLLGFSRGAAGQDVSDLGWTVIVRQPVEHAFAPAQEMRLHILLSGFVFAGIFGALGWLAAGWIARPLRLIATEAERMRAGEPGAAIPEITRGAKEIGTLSRALRELVTSLTASKAALARMEDIAYQDRLTALPNRRFFEQYLDVALSRARAEMGHVAALYIDLDGFKPVNDRLGHDAGDEVLRQVGVRLASSLRGDDVVARIGGDEFAAILVSSGCSGLANLDEVTARIIAAVNEVVVVQGQPVRVGCSIGVALWPLDGPDLSSVLKHADEALYEAKRRGKNQAVSYASMAASPLPESD